MLVGKKPKSVIIDSNPSYEVKSGLELLKYVLAYVYELDSSRLTALANPTGNYYVFNIRPSRDAVELNNLYGYGTGLMFDKKIGNKEVIKDVAQAMLDFGISSIVIIVE